MVTSSIAEASSLWAPTRPDHGAEEAGPRPPVGDERLARLCDFRPVKQMQSTWGTADAHDGGKAAGNRVPMLARIRNTYKSKTDAAQTMGT